jgi:hypothetical protein
LIVEALERLRSHSCIIDGDFNLNAARAPPHWQGAPIRHLDVETRVKPLPDQTAEQVARRLVREMHGTDPRGGFYRRLRYSSKGIV